MSRFMYAVGVIAGAAGLWMLVLCLSILAGAVELHITGNATGSGLQALNISGDWVNATYNGSAWTITAVTP